MTQSGLFGRKLACDVSSLNPGIPEAIFDLSLRRLSTQGGAAAVGPSHLPTSSASERLDASERFLLAVPDPKQSDAPIAYPLEG